MPIPDFPDRMNIAAFVIQVNLTLESKADGCQRK
jgi:hypothetical protein